MRAVSLEALRCPGWGLLFFSVMLPTMAKERAKVEEYAQFETKQGFQKAVCKG